MMSLSKHFIVLSCMVFAGCESSVMFRDDSTAVALAQRVDGVKRIEKYPGHFDWQVVMWCTASGGVCPPVTGTEPQARFPVRVVCYCKVDVERPSGWFIEADLSKRKARAISGNRALERSYGFADPGGVGNWLRFNGSAFTKVTAEGQQPID
jgi:hypothetical protein